jgi:glycerol-3-phosphate acyltransferase PlsX
MFTISVDVMSGDLGPNFSLTAINSFLVKSKDVSVLLFVSEDVSSIVDSWKMSLKYEEASRIRIKSCSQVVHMDDSPAFALRHKSNSTMTMSIKAVKDKQANACFSCGNTGALMMIGRHYLSMIHNMDRPALATDILLQKKPLLMLDLGANIDSTADQLFSFAVIGSAYRKAQGISSPEVALLNIGKEKGKGSECMQLTAELLSNADEIDFIGNIEGDQLYSEKTDIVVCDGVNGNIALKTSEGMVPFLIKEIDRLVSTFVVKKFMWARLKVFLCQSSTLLNVTQYGGAILLGLNGLVVKGHGNSDEIAIEHALGYTLKQLRNDTLAKCYREMTGITEK